MAVSAAQHDPGSVGDTRMRLLVRGAVQGVGFRPFVYRCARALGLTGWVGNSPEGVAVEVEGPRDRIAAFFETIRADGPPNASVTTIETREIGLRGDDAFRIIASVGGGQRTVEVVPDLATCEECLQELFDPADRRYLYPFINCTQCGPRYSIVEDLPYDRARTSMRHFPMCPTCRAEYDDPADRRFHAEPNACPDCGPRLALWDGAGNTLCRDHTAMLAAAAAIRQGQIVAVKGIGGFHLFVDARDENSVQRLRMRKRRVEKPFAVMFPTTAEVAASCRLSPAEEHLLTDTARPIVVLRRTGELIAQSVAPGCPLLGALLPYAPVHHVLMRQLGFPVVATSGNVTDEPIVTDESTALRRLAGIADLFLVHDRPIARPVEDSVARVVCGGAQIIRRARGYAPAPIAAQNVPAGILAVGGHLKTTVALTQSDRIVLGPHIGDLDTPGAREAHARALDDIVRLYAANASLIARDLHPDYAASAVAEAFGLPVVQVQHHLAHVVACMAEHAATPPVLGVAFDGMGLGPDGTLWGGEFLHVTHKGWRRVAHLRPFRLPGGDAAMREPRRAAIGLLFEAVGDAAFMREDLAPLRTFSQAERSVLRGMLARGVNAPWTTSAGRLFDAFAALADLRQYASYEGRAAAEFEWAAEGRATGRRHEMAVRAARDPAAPLIVDWQPALEAALADLRAGAPPGAISEAVHNGLAMAIVEIARRTGEQRIVLTGGCFQNLRLTEATDAALRAAGFDVLLHRRVPANDGGIALGQALWAAWMDEQGRMPCA